MTDLGAVWGRSICDRAAASLALHRLHVTYLVSIPREISAVVHFDTCVSHLPFVRVCTAAPVAHAMPKCYSALFWTMDLSG